MTKKKRTPATSIFIACEGKNTEPIYFERISEEIEEMGQLVVTIYPDRNEDNPKSDALGLIKEAQSRIDDYDEVWVVFDKDGYTKHKEAFELADQLINNKKIKVAFSSIAFEQWVLLHFEKCSTPFPKSENVIKKLQEEKYYPDYSKKANFDIYPTLRDKTKIAIENAAWLRYTIKSQLVNTPIFELSSYTDIDFLVKKLFGIDNLITWASLNNQYNLDGLIITPRLMDNNLTFEITNDVNVSYLLNQNNLQDNIQVFNSQDIIIPITIEQTTLIEPGQTLLSKIQLPADAVASYCHFNHNRITLKVILQ
ncbi:hypothetical protein GCM10023189_44930 [Nibrella saemangeumensis]|uniref:RloB-like protein n=1 Tax=Nibrella saemangeumensis TaxID=1084526 RepID=A0ABP8NG27_9BACT